MYSLDIILNEKTSTKIRFETKAEMEHYVKEELNATRAEFVRRIQAFSKRERDNATKNLYNARMKFAKDMGYIKEEKRLG